MGICRQTAAVHVRLRGSLGATGRGHGTPAAVVAGLDGAKPGTCEPEAVATAWTEEEGGRARLAPEAPRVPVTVEFAPFQPHPEHANSLDLEAHGADGTELYAETYLSTGGGFIRRVGDVPSTSSHRPPHVFTTFDDLLARCDESQTSIAQIVRDNGLSRGQDPDATAIRIWTAMKECISRGRNAQPGVLPGGLNVRRRAPALANRLSTDDSWTTHIARIQLDALAVNEENAAGGRIVTAPTNGAAGVVPAVIAHHARQAEEDHVVDMLLTATAIGSIITTTASISGAQVGCQGEIGSACAMAAAALAAANGASPRMIGKAAEIGLEHHLGLTCDPVGGLVQIPCIERNAIAAVTATQAATLAMNEPDHEPKVSLDVVIRTMRRVGEDMLDKYKETSLGGLAISVTEC